MELHKAIREIVASQGAGMVNNIQIINFLLDYQAFKEKPATKLILRDIINLGYAEKILALNKKEEGWQTKLLQYQHDFIDSCGYKDNLVTFVFESIAFALGMNLCYIKPYDKEMSEERPDVEQVYQPKQPKHYGLQIEKTKKQINDETKRWALRLVGLSEVKTTFFSGAYWSVNQDLEDLGIIGPCEVKRVGGLTYKAHPVLISDRDEITRIIE